ncbi:Vitamin B12 import ATP-binding protein BtuD [Sporomusa silvacetica DSM 10669]|uniref:Vitamin B12 import ATP-binding protein BtuD n=1 Tax=Sporomusa silvacetica DSM 10669 TaxID=1123289 RepID=A0ABZ3IM75_9FIRM|nr:ABC transporter ATP-binding protein [Sporomusa silvacetica]OZC22995.1 heterocyst differentiation ATP-binding protein HepA [Sporomusa silvacetica DSM 10669]
MNTLLSYMQELYAFCKLKLIVNLVLMVFLGLIEGGGVLLLIPLLSLAGIISGVPADGSWAFKVQGLFQVCGLAPTLPVVLGLYIVIIAGQSWLQRSQAICSVAIQQSFTSFLSIRLFRAIAYTRWLFLLSRAKADITHVLTTEVMRVGNGTHFFLQLLATGLIGIIQIGLAFLIAPGLTLFILGGGAVLFICSYPFIRQSRRMGLSISEFTRNLMFEVTEHLNGIKEVKSYGMEPVQIRNFATLRHTIERNFVRFTAVQSHTDFYYKVGAAVFISLFFYTAITFFKLNPQEFVLIVVIFARLWPRFSSFQVGLQYVVMMLPAFKAVLQLERCCLEEQELLLEEQLTTRLELTQGIEFRDVSFCYYAGRFNYAVDGVSVVLAAGTTTAFVGVSGSGKSTMVDLLLGLLTPERGGIFVDGRPLAQSLQVWRQSIGYVPQDSFLWNASIRANLQWACPEASESAMWETLGLAAVDEFVRSLPAGLDTVVGDRGVRLSGGERQRIVLARALLRKPSVLILDEATSSLDTENESRIQQALEDLHGKLTIVVIAHRLSTIRQADRIYVLEQGRVLEQGDYLSLSKNKGGRFAALASVSGTG